MKMHYKFTPNQWIIFDYQNGSIAIGYTNYKNSKPVIMFASDVGKTGIISYDKVVNPRKLCIESRESNNIREAAEILPDVMISFRKGKA